MCSECTRLERWHERQLCWAGISLGLGPTAAVIAYAAVIAAIAG